MTSALGVLAQLESEVEYHLDQVGNVAGFGVGGSGRCGKN